MLHSHVVVLTVTRDVRDLLTRGCVPVESSWKLSCRKRMEDQDCSLQPEMQNATIHRENLLHSAQPCRSWHLVVVGCRHLLSPSLRSVYLFAFADLVVAAAAVGIERLMCLEPTGRCATRVLLSPRTLVTIAFISFAFWIMVSPDANEPINAWLAPPLLSACFSPSCCFIVRYS